jgi:hypothetical protein
VGQLAKASEPTTCEDSSICPEDFFHVPNRLSEDEEVPEVDSSSMHLGIYTMTEGASKNIMAFLCCVAVCHNVTGPNVESWVTAVEQKLGDIGITTFQMSVAEVHTTNSKLSRAGHVPMFTNTLDVIVQLGVEDMQDGTESKMVSYLQAVAAAKNLSGRDVRTWAMEVHTKLQVLDIVTIKLTVSWIVTLNHELCHVGLSMMHHQTLDLMAQMGIQVLLQSAPEEHPERSSSSNQVLAGQEDSNELSENQLEESDDPNEFESDGGHCTNCNGPGTIQESCLTVKKMAESI